MWITILQIALSALSFVMLVLLRPKVESPKPASEDDLQIPKAEEGDEAPRIYGTRWIENPQVVWYGDFKSKAIKKKGGKK